MIKSVYLLESSSSSRLLKPFFAFRTVFNVLAGIFDARLDGLEVWLCSLNVALFRSWKSIYYILSRFSIALDFYHWLQYVVASPCGLFCSAPIFAS